MFIFKALCALAAAFLCANGQYATPFFKSAEIFSLKLAKYYPIRDQEQVLFKVECPSKCKIREIRISGLVGGLTLYANSDTDFDICDTQGQPCYVMKIIDEKVFYITLTPNPSFSFGHLIVDLGQKGAKITELNAEGAMRLSKNLIRIKSGYKKPDYRPQRYKIQCNGPCSIYDVGAYNDVLVAISKEPVFETKDGCFNCFCVWKQNQNNPTCDSSGNLGSSIIYVTLINYRKNFRDAKAYVSGNFKSVELYDNLYRSKAYDYKNGYKAVASVVIGPTSNNKEINFYVWCEDNTACTDIKIEILTDSKSLVKAVRAGKDPSLNSRGQCKDCDCTSRQSCLGRFDPSLSGSGVTKMFEINIKLGSSKRKRPAYVRVSGKGLREIQNNDGAYYYYYY